MSKVIKKSSRKLGYLIFGILTVGLMGYLFINRSVIAPQTESSKLQVAASFYPLYFFASEIGKEKATVFSITPSGVEPHDYDPTAQDVARLQRSDLLILNGAGFEPWAEKTKADLEKKNVRIIDTTDGLELQEGEAHEEEEAGEKHEEEPLDPHVWLSPVLAKEQVDKITEGFVAIDSANASFYEANAGALKEKLDALHAAYQTALQTCQTRDFITAHAAFGYLANTYNLTQTPISGLSPEEEPSAGELAEIVEFARNNNVQYIFFEELVSPKLSETIAQEAGAQTLVLSPIEGLSAEEMTVGGNYFTKMRENLHNLKTALACQ